MTFQLAGSFSGYKHADLEKTIKKHGGDVVKDLDVLTHFIATETDWNAQKTKSKACVSSSSSTRELGVRVGECSQRQGKEQVASR